METRCAAALVIFRLRSHSRQAERLVAAWHLLRGRQTATVRLLRWAPVWIQERRLLLVGRSKRRSKQRSRGRSGLLHRAARRCGWQALGWVRAWAVVRRLYAGRW